LVSLFAVAASELAEGAAPQIISYTEAASTVFDLVEKAIEAMRFLTGVNVKEILGEGTHLHAQIIFLRNVVLTTMREFSIAAIEMSTDMSATVVAYIEAASAVFGLVEEAIEAMRFLTGVDISAILGEGVHLHRQILFLRNVVLTTMREFSVAAREMRTSGTEAIIRYIDAARAVFGLVEEAIATITILAEYSFVAELTPKIEAFKSDFLAVAGMLLDAVGGLAEDVEGLLVPATDLSESIQALLGVVQPAVDALAGISDYVRIDNLWVKLIEFGEGFLFIVATLNRKLYEIDQGIGSETLAASAGIAESINTVIGVMQPAIDALASLREFVRIDNLWVKLIEFGNDFLLLVGMLNRKLYEIDQGIGTEVLAISAEIATSINSVISVIGPAIEALAGIGEFVKIDNLIVKLSEFTSQLSEAIGGESGLVVKLNEIAGLVGDTEVETASNFATSINAILDSVMGIFRALGDMANADMPGGLKNILADMIAVLRSAIPDAGAAGYDFGMAWINGVREALGALQLDMSGGPGLAGAAAGAATSGGLTTNLNLGGLTFHTTITNQMDEEEFHFRVIESIRSLV
jgi:hypothetical protein